MSTMTKKLSPQEICDFLFKPMTDEQQAKMVNVNQREKVVNNMCSCLVGVLPCL